MYLLVHVQVLHKYLDDAVVSFVGITNHILDAAKTNRAVTLFRPRATDVSFTVFDTAEYLGVKY